MKKAFLALALASSFSAIAMAADYKGYIIDEKCSKVASMKGDVDCANKCLKGGSPAVLLTDDGTVYKIADQAKVTPMAGKQVTISGKLDGDTLKVDRIRPQAQ